MTADEQVQPDPAGELRAARADLGVAVAEIRRLPGHAEFLVQPGFGEIATASKRQPLIYLAATAETGVALVVSGPGVVPVPLPELTDDAVRGAAGRLTAASADTLDEICRWLWDAVFGPLLGALHRLTRATLIPCGPLAGLPLHAAWHPVEDGRRYALDEMTLSYAPSAGALGAAAEAGASVQADRLLGVVDPAVGADPLPGAAWEMAAASRAFDSAEVLAYGDATLAAVRAALPRASVLHFAGHGAGGSDPLDGALLMAGGQPLSLRDLLGLRARLRLVVVSTTGDGPRAEDVAAALLQAGAGGVVAAQWGGGGPAAAMLLAEFYRLWRQRSLTPAEALRRAQQWVRDTTNGAKAEAYAQARSWLGAEAAEALHAVVAAADPDERGYAPTVTWGGFAYFGV